MLIRLEDLRDLTARTAEGNGHTVLDLFVRRTDLTATHVLIRLGTWFDRSECALRIRTMGEPDVGEDSWPANVDEDQVRRAPREPGPGTTADADIDVAVVAPEGEALDPARLSDTECALSEAKAGDLVRLGELLDAPVRDSAGTEAVSVMDAILDSDGWRVAMLVVRTGAGGVANQRVVPMDMIAGVDWSPAGVSLRCGAQALADAPDLHEAGARIEGHWYNRVLAYYGIG
ncbi:MAG: hypothetical protein WBA25_19830 [Jannaschia sp.]